MIQVKLSGRKAMWRDPSCATGDYSALLPSPSSIIGWLGNVMGFEWQSNHFPDNPWPFSPDLITWFHKNKVEIAIGVDKNVWPEIWSSRLDVSGNRNKNNDFNHAQIVRSAVFNPAYEIVIKGEDLSLLDTSLEKPVRRGYLGESSCPAFWHRSENNNVFWTGITQHRPSLGTMAFVIDFNQKSRLKKIGYLAVDQTLNEPQFVQAVKE